MEIFNFYPRPPRGGRLLRVLACTALFSISIHALREEGDILDNYGFAVATDFYPRPPRGGRQRDVLGTFATPGISIHALREEGD